MFSGSHLLMIDPSLVGWLHRAKGKGCRYLVIARDSFTSMQYPIYVKEGENLWDKISHLTPSGEVENIFAGFTLKDTADEVYDLEIDISLQLNERRAWHPPTKLDA